jgi:hypothetical protein
MVGVDATGIGVTDADGEDAALVPLVFVAVTVNVYAVLFVKPVTRIGLDAPEPVIESGDDVTVYPLIAAPPFAGATNDTEDCALAVVPTTEDGASGTVFTVTELVAVDAAAFPFAFPAVTVNV